MPFVADPKTLTTEDVGRGLALRTVGGGSDGVVRFAIDGALEPFGFSAHATFEPDPRAATSNATAPNLIAWRVHWHGFALAGFDETPTMELIREALLAFKGGHGTPKRQSARVEFTRGASDQIIG